MRQLRRQRDPRQPPTTVLLWRADQGPQRPGFGVPCFVSSAGLVFLLSLVCCLASPGSSGSALASRASLRKQSIHSQRCGLSDSKLGSREPETAARRALMRNTNGRSQRSETQASHVALAQRFRINSGQQLLNQQSSSPALKSTGGAGRLGAAANAMQGTGSYRIHPLRWIARQSIPKLHCRGSSPADNAANGQGTSSWAMPCCQTHRLAERKRSNNAPADLGRRPLRLSVLFKHLQAATGLHTSSSTRKLLRQRPEEQPESPLACQKGSACTIRPTRTATKAPLPSPKAGRG